MVPPAVLSRHCMRMHLTPARGNAIQIRRRSRCEILKGTIESFSRTKETFFHAIQTTADSTGKQVLPPPAHAGARSVLPARTGQRPVERLSCLRTARTPALAPAHRLLRDRLVVVPSVQRDGSLCPSEPGLALGVARPWHQLAHWGRVDS